MKFHFVNSFLLVGVFMSGGCSEGVDPADTNPSTQATTESSGYQSIDDNVLHSANWYDGSGNRVLFATHKNLDRTSGNYITESWPEILNNLGIVQYEIRLISQKYVALCVRLDADLSAVKSSIINSPREPYRMIVVEERSINSGGPKCSTEL